MKRFTLILFSFVILMSFSIHSAEDVHTFKSPEQRQVFDELLKELRCPKCQNQNIADSNAIVAMDIKNKVYEMVTNENNKGEVIDYMIDRYGYFVHYKPPLTLATISLWLIPIVFVILGGGVALFKTRVSDKVSSKLKWSEANEVELQAILLKYSVGSTAADDTKLDVKGDVK